MVKYKIIIGGFLMAGKKGMKHYPIELREKLVQLRLSGEKSLTQLTKEFSIDKTQILDWCKWKEQYGIPRQLTGKKKGRVRHTVETLEEKVKRLEMENTLLKKFHELLEEEHKKK